MVPVRWKEGKKKKREREEGRKGGRADLPSG